MAKTRIIQFVGVFDKNRFSQGSILVDEDGNILSGRIAISEIINILEIGILPVRIPVNQYNDTLPKKPDYSFLRARQAARDLDNYNEKIFDSDNKRSEKVQEPVADSLPDFPMHPVPVDQPATPPTYVAEPGEFNLEETTF